jgi:hypothetical protein
VAGQLIGQQLATGLALDDSFGHQFAGLLSWSIPTAGFLGLILYNAFAWRQSATEPVVADER